MVNWHKYFLVDAQNLFINLKGGFRGSLSSDFDKTIDQSKCQWIFLEFFALIIKINYPHLAGGPQSPSQELEVGGHRPPYLLVSDTVAISVYTLGYIIDAVVISVDTST